MHTDISIWRKLEIYYRDRHYGPTVMDRYIFFEILNPFMVTLFFWTTLFMTIVLKDVIGELLGKGIPLYKILQYLGYLIAEKISQTIPMACLFSGIMAAGRLSGDSEITALRSAGISFPRIYSVFIFFGFLAMIAVTAINFYLGPINAKAREDFEDWLKTYHSLTLVKPGSFMGGSNMNSLSKTGQDIYAENRDGDVLLNVQIRQWFNALDANKSEMVNLGGVVLPIGDGYIKQVINAQTGELLSRKNKFGIEETFIRLKKGYILEISENRSGYQMTNFSDGFMDYVIPPPVKQMGRLNVRPDNYTINELFQFLENMEKGGNKIDVCAMTQMCQGESLPSTTVVSDEGTEEELPPGIIVVPSMNEMEFQLTQLKLWLMTNMEKVGKPDGPSEEEFTMKSRLMLQFTIFLKDSETTKRKFEVEIQKRMATPVASILFFFVAFPLGLVVKRSGKGMGFALALMVFGIYYIFLTLGLSNANSGSVSPFVGAWLPDIVIAIMGVYIMSKRTEGFTPFKKILNPVYRVLGFIFTPVIRVIYPARLHSYLAVKIEKFLNLFRRVPFLKKMFEN